MNDIYTTPKSNLVGDKTPVDGKRPGWVWAIFIFHTLSLVSVAASFYLIFTGVLLMVGEQKQYFNDLGLMGWLMVVVPSLLSFSAALTLFMLRKISIKIWLAAIVFAVVSTLYSLLDIHWLNIMNGSGSIGLVIGFSIKIAIYFYARRLAARGILK